MKVKNTLQELYMGYISLDEEFNIETKKMYHKWFNKYIEDGDKEAFKNAVIAMGNTYHVLRTLPKKYRKAFFKDIWKYKDEIKMIKESGILIK